jgi:opacity protein-like surface antigen
MRFILFTLLLTLVSTFAVAQVSIGLRAGYGFSDLQSDDAFDAVSDQFSNASSLAFGIYAELPFSEVFSLRSGVEIKRRGTTVMVTQDATVFGATVPTGAEAKTRFSYIDVPLLAQVNIPTGGKIQPYVFGGASFGYATNGNIRTTAPDIIEFNLMTADIDLENIDYERFHVAAVGGLGVRATLSEKIKLFVEGRYEQGLTESYEVPLATAKTGFKGMNFGAGFAITL